MAIKRTKKGTLKWSIIHRPPITVTMISAALLLLMSSKGIIIDRLPISNADQKEILGSWYIYILEVLGVVFGFLQIFLGLDKSDKPVGYGNFDPNKEQ